MTELLGFALSAQLAHMAAARWRRPPAGVVAGASAPGMPAAPHASPSSARVMGHAAAADGHPEDTLERMCLWVFLRFHISRQNFIEIRLSIVK